MLGDVERIRAERKKARSNKAKYTGVEGGAMGGFSGSSGGSGGGRYGGFGSESAGYGGSSAGYGGYSGGVYGDGGGFGGQPDEWRDPDNHSRADKFEAYDEYDEGGATSSSSRPKQAERVERVGVKKTTPAPPPKKKEPEVDLFSFDDPAPVPAAASTVAPTSASSGLAALSSPAHDDDDFDDFQSATPAAPTSVASNSFAIQPPMMTSMAHSTAQFAAPKPVSAPQQASLTDMMSSLSPPSSSTATPVANYSSFNRPAPAGISAAPQPTTYQAAAPNYFQSVQVPQSTGPSGLGMGSLSSAGSIPSGMSAHNKPAAPTAAKASSGVDPFANLWGTAGSGLKKTSTPTAGPKLGQLAKEKTSASLWGAPTANTPKPAGNTATSSSGLDDLLG
jgi:epsin